MVWRLIDFAFVGLELLMFKVCGILGISKIEFFIFSVLYKCCTNVVQICTNGTKLRDASQIKFHFLDTISRKCETLLLKTFSLKQKKIKYFQFLWKKSKEINKRNIIW